MAEIINKGTFIIVVLTFFITLGNTLGTIYSNRASIKVRQFSTSNSVLIRPDFVDIQTPDVYWGYEYRVLADVVIINQSAKPISIIEYVLNNDLKFNSYTKPGSSYVVTLDSGKENKNGLISHGPKRYKTYSINDSYLQPLIDIPPYTSKRGYLFFHSSDKESVDLGKNKLEIVTSRKTFVKDLDIFQFEQSPLQLPDDIYKARDLFDSQNPS